MQLIVPAQGSLNAVLRRFVFYHILRRNQFEKSATFVYYFN